MWLSPLTPENLMNEPVVGKKPVHFTSLNFGSIALAEELIEKWVLPYTKRRCGPLVIVLRDLA
jgi:hypothetical protein